MASVSGGFRGEGGTPGPCPPFETYKKINTYKSVGFPPPLPPACDLRDFRRWWRSGKKKCWSPPPPPPPAIISYFLGLARLSRLAAVREKNSVLCPPPPLFLYPGSAPGFVIEIHIPNTCFENNMFHAYFIFNQALCISWTV